MPRPLVLVTEPFDPEAMERLAAAAEVRMASGLDESTLAAEATDAEGIVLRAGGAVTRRVIEAAPRLRVIGRHGVGVDHVDRRAAAEREVVVVNTPDANRQAVAEHALAMMLALSSRLVEGDSAVRAGDWQARHRLRGTELRGRLLGVVGFGGIGRRLGMMASCLGMEVAYHDPATPTNEAAPPGARPMALDELLKTADVVSIHVPLLPSTRRLIDEHALRSMKTSAFLINTARGAVVDQSALERALAEGWIAGAGLDVFDPEPPPPDCALLALPNVVVTPHMAAHTAEALRAMAGVVDDVLAVLRGEPPLHPVPPPDEEEG
ncbi:MAG: hydroxyacid dehydrogenase [Actinobacteria bacterium]|nr:hydroxyacid dehydrogenase [Actinomycetota bacterium]